MIGPGERVRILDFGLAKQAAGSAGAGAEAEASTELTAPRGALMGNVRYMSPEQVRGELAGARSEVLSLGMILYEMAAGARPFSGEGPAEVMSSILRDTPAAPTRLRPELPRHLGRIILQCLEKEPARRSQTAVASSSRYSSSLSLFCYLFDAGRCSRNHLASRSVARLPAAANTTPPPTFATWIVGDPGARNCSNTRSSAIYKERSNWSFQNSFTTLVSSVIATTSIFASGWPSANFFQITASPRHAEHSGENRMTVCSTA